MASASRTNRLKLALTELQSADRRRAVVPELERMFSRPAGIAKTGSHARSLATAKRKSLSASPKLATSVQPRGLAVKHRPAVGKTRQLTDNSQTETDSYSYRAYGQTLSNMGSTTDPFTWVGEPGYVKDEATGDHTLRRRTYEAGLARFLSEDPAQSDPNLYRYAGDSPTNAADPNGLAGPGEAWTEAGMIEAFTELYGDNELAMRAMLLIVSTFEFRKGTQLWWNEWHVDHENHIIYIADDWNIAWSKTNRDAAEQLYQILADEFFKVTNLSETWEHYFYRKVGAGSEVVFGGVGAIGGTALFLAPDVTLLTKVGGAGAVTFSLNSVAEGATCWCNREGGVDLIGEAFGWYGQSIAGDAGEDTARYWIGWSGFLFNIAGAAGPTALGRIPLRQLPSATREAMQRSFLKMQAKYGHGGSVESINLASPQRTKHILTGDATGGGHKFGLRRLFNGKSKFPCEWSDNKILEAIAEVATDPANTWVQKGGKPGSLFTKAGNPVRFEVLGTFEGVRLKVIVEGSDIPTAFPKQ